MQVIETILIMAIVLICLFYVNNILEREDTNIVLRYTKAIILVAVCGFIIYELYKIFR